MKRGIFIFLGLFAAGAGVTLALRMSADAMAVIIGVVFGLLATVPTTFIMLYALRRNESQNQYRQQMGQYPPVIVVNSGQSGVTGGNMPALVSPGMGERNFKVVGGESTPAETLGDAFNLNAIWDEV